MDNITFIPSDSYTGHKPGYYFSRGEEGLGYYPLKENKPDFAALYESFRDNSLQESFHKKLYS